MVSTKRKRGRPPASASHASQRDPPNPDATGDANANAGDEEVARPRKRGRPSKAQLQQEEAPASPPRATSSKQQTKEKAPRRRRGAKAAPVEEDVPEEQAQETGRRGRRKARNEPDPTSQEEVADESTARAAPPPGKRRRGRPSGQRESLGAQDEATTKRKRGRGRKQNTPPPEREVEEEEEEESQHEEQERPPSRRSPSRESSPSESDSELPTKPYLHVASFVRGIRQSTIDAKWTALAGPSIAAATETLELAHRPILQRLSNSEQRRQHTSSALAVLYRRITRKLHKGLPFPPATASATGSLVARRRRGGGDGGRELELDFERVLDASQALERQLDPALHAVELLRKEKERLERELERDYKTLQNLEAGARGQSRQQREQLKKAHVLTPHATTSRAGDDVELAFDDEGPVPPGALFKDLQGEEEIKELALQLGGHVESIKANLKQTEGLLPQLSLSKAALRGVLYQHLTQAQYEKVLFG
ncbi:unnamed protein product [Clonostachys rosea f. rosea IK726]|uniref:Uncharacterized protein n=1 Tax=Clonostachys rosea f. rosea IK726 TaxID=1349383 RepID=A0ACA9TTH8_BIOOC|nr:unnamed protein product [Clonostachys rosea f. rosea IK726]